VCNLESRRDFPSGNGYKPDGTRTSSSHTSRCPRGLCRRSGYGSPVGIGGTRGLGPDLPVSGRYVSRVDSRNTCGKRLFRPCARGSGMVGASASRPLNRALIGWSVSGGRCFPLVVSGSMVITKIGVRFEIGISDATAGVWGNPWWCTFQLPCS
jgi:hypothetical protein